MLHRSLTKRLVNHARPNDVTEGYACQVNRWRRLAEDVGHGVDEWEASKTGPRWFPAKR